MSTEKASSCMSFEALKKMYTMHLDNQFCDAQFVMDDGTIFNIHRAILSACSDYFWLVFPLSNLLWSKLFLFAALYSQQK